MTSQPTQERVACVTGAGRGIGKAIALALAKDGWHLGVIYRSSRQGAEDTVKLAREHGVHAVALQADIAKADDRQRLVDGLIEEFGRIDLLVNNAGMAPRVRQDILNMTPESFDEVMDVNLRGTLFLTQRVAREMVKQRQEGQNGGMIVNIGSISAYTSSPARAEYCISKAGLAMMTKLFADRLAKHRINVYEIRPGIIATDMTHGVRDKYDRLITDGLTPISRWGQPNDIGQAVAAIASGAFPFSTGEVINVDGGFHLRRL